MLSLIKLAIQLRLTASDVAVVLEELHHYADCRLLLVYQLRAHPTALNLSLIHI